MNMVPIQFIRANNRDPTIFEKDPRKYGILAIKNPGKYGKIVSINLKNPRKSGTLRHIFSDFFSNPRKYGCQISSAKKEASLKNIISTKTTNF